MLRDRQGGALRRACELRHASPDLGAAPYDRGGEVGHRAGGAEARRGGMQLGQAARHELHERAAIVRVERRGERRRLDAVLPEGAARLVVTQRRGNFEGARARRQAREVREALAQLGTLGPAEGLGVERAARRRAAPVAQRRPLLRAVVNQLGSLVEERAELRQPRVVREAPEQHVELRQPRRRAGPAGARRQLGTHVARVDLAVQDLARALAGFHSVAHRNAAGAARRIASWGAPRRVQHHDTPDVGVEAGNRLQRLAHCRGIGVEVKIEHGQAASSELERRPPARFSASVTSSWTSSSRPGLSEVRQRQARSWIRAAAACQRTCAALIGCCALSR